MADPVFTGVGVALVTLFDDDDGVDLDATAELAHDLAAAGMQAIVIAGSTGEAATLDGPERVALVKVVREAIPAAVPIVVGTGAPSAHQAARLTAEVVAGGADAVLVLSPPLAADPVPYYREVVSAAGAVPVLGYHFPLMSAPGIDVDALPAPHRRRRRRAQGLVSGDPARLVRTLETFDGDLYVGSPWLLSAAGPLGATGAILAVANVEPELSIAAFDGDVAAQRQLAATAQRAAGPAGVKAVLAERTGRSSRTRSAEYKWRWASAARRHVYDAARPGRVLPVPHREAGPRSVSPHTSSTTSAVTRTGCGASALSLWSRCDHGIDG